MLVGVFTCDECDDDDDPLKVVPGKASSLEAVVGMKSLLLTPFDGSHGSVFQQVSNSPWLMRPTRTSGHITYFH